MAVPYFVVSFVRSLFNRLFAQSTQPSRRERPCSDERWSAYTPLFSLHPLREGRNEEQELLALFDDKADKMSLSLILSFSSTVPYSLRFGCLRFRINTHPLARWWVRAKRINCPEGERKYNERTWFSTVDFDRRDAKTIIFLGLDTIFFFSSRAIRKALECMGDMGNVFFFALISIDEVGDCLF